MTRFKLSSISTSLDFYLTLGYLYWVLNSVGTYYCDLPIPKKGFSSINAMVRQANTATLLGTNMDKIKMWKSYMLTILNDKKHSA